jgi:hypothetical protein
MGEYLIKHVKYGRHCPTAGNPVLIPGQEWVLKEQQTNGIYAN